MSSILASSAIGSNEGSFFVAKYFSAVSMAFNRLRVVWMLASIPFWFSF